MGRELQSPNESEEFDVTSPKFRLFTTLAEFLDDDHSRLRLAPILTPSIKNEGTDNSSDLIVVDQSLDSFGKAVGL